MRVSPRVSTHASVWTAAMPNLLGVGVWTEKNGDRGEDAEPLVIHHHPTGAGILAVCDGVGGAGVQIAGPGPDGIRRSDAWIASRAVRMAVEQWFDEQIDHVTASSTRGRTAGSQERPRPSLHATVADVLAQVRVPARRRILGTMRRELPTTLALIQYEIAPPTFADATEIRVTVRWAGDSRCFLLTAEEGLQQLSVDDTELPDPLESLTQDPPMTNHISAGRKFRISDVKVPGAIPLPCLLLCATDGFFNYVQTPAGFEYVLLDTLARVEDVDRWAQALADAVRSYTQDDATLALLAFGHADFGELKRSLLGRRQELVDIHIAPLANVPHDNPAALAAARRRSWERYRGTYERRLPGRPGGSA